MKPLIGVTSSMEVDEAYYMMSAANVKAVLQAGGIPLILPYLTEETDVKQIAAKIDGLFTPGGYDIDPTLFHEEPHPGLGTIIPARDRFEMYLVGEMLKLDKPILGVCRGTQILNIAMGGDMYQDIYSQSAASLLQHQQKAPLGHGSHFVHIQKNTLLHRLTESEKIRVNSRHHQANRRVESPLIISGKASDDIVEAIESTEHRFVLGLQWHPENMAAHQDDASIRIFKGFIDACKKKE